MVAERSATERSVSASHLARYYLSTAMAGIASPGSDRDPRSLREQLEDDAEIIEIEDYGEGVKKWVDADSTESTESSGPGFSLIQDTRLKSGRAPGQLACDVPGATATPKKKTNPQKEKKKRRWKTKVRWQNLIQ